MNPVHTYYETLLQLIETGVSGVCTGTYPARSLEVDLISLSGKANLAKTPITWGGARDANELSLFLRCVNDSESINDDNFWNENLLDLVLAAFKDLSPMKNPDAMRTFEKICMACHVDEDALFMWSRKVTERQDGSAVIILHVSNLDDFKKVAMRIHTRGNLENGLSVPVRNVPKFNVRK